MPSITIDKRFRGPPNSGNGGYVCGLLAGHIDGRSAEITLRAPPPLARPLNIVPGAHGAMDLRDGDRILATGRSAQIEVSEIPTASYAEAEEAARCTPFDESNHKLFSTCFVCGPARAAGDGLRIIAGPLRDRTDRKTGAFAASWVPYADLAGDDGCVAAEFVWACLDCPTAFSGVGSGYWGLKAIDPILLGRMSARIDKRPKPGERCVVVAWPTGREGRKLFASSALLRIDGEVLAVAKTTWLSLDRQAQLGES
jgi:hypothetical protein